MLSNARTAVSLGKRTLASSNASHRVSASRVERTDDRVTAAAGYNVDGADLAARGGEMFLDQG